MHVRHHAKWQWNLWRKSRRQTRLWVMHERRTITLSSQCVMFTVNSSLFIRRPMSTVLDTSWYGFGTPCAGRSTLLYELSGVMVGQGIGNDGWLITNRSRCSIHERGLYWCRGATSPLRATKDRGHMSSWARHEMYDKAAIVSYLLRVSERTLSCVLAHIPRQVRRCSPVWQRDLLKHVLGRSSAALLELGFPAQGSGSSLSLSRPVSIPVHL